VVKRSTAFSNIEKFKYLLNSTVGGLIVTGASLTLSNKMPPLISTDAIAVLKYKSNISNAFLLPSIVIDWSSFVIAILSKA